MLWKECEMKPYQVNFFSDESRIPDSLPSEPIFVYENKRYLNFLPFDCFHLKNNEFLKEVVQNSIKKYGIASIDGRLEIMSELENKMKEIKKLDSILVFPDEISAFFAIFSIFGPKMTYFVDYETNPSISAVLQDRNTEYYSHKDPEQLGKILSAKSEKLIIIDGMYEWLGSISPVNDLVKVAQENECIIVGNELNSFGLLGRDGRGFVDLFNIYDAMTIDVGSYSKYLGGFGCYIGAKKYLINKIRENIMMLTHTMPQFMLAANHAGLELMITEKNKEFKTLWQHSRYFISRLKQTGFNTISETPIVVISFNNNEEAGEFTKRLFLEQIVVAQNKERIRLCLSVEHTKEDLNYCLEKLESIADEIGANT
jgi:glycine C-acetyltransferase